MEIRARISLVVDNLKQNAKLAGDSFKTISSAAKVSTDKIDGYLETQAQNEEARIRRTEAMELQSLRRREKAYSKFNEQQYQNTGGITPGTNVGMPLPVTNNKSAFERSEIERYHAWWVNSEKQVQQENTRTAKEALERRKDAIEGFKGWQKNEEKRYSSWLERNTKDQVRTQEKSARELANEKFQVKVDFFANDEDFNRRLAATRYALYDIGRRAIAFGTAVATGMGTAVKAAIDFESAFTSVERTAQVDLGSPYASAAKEARDLRDSLLEISTTIPVAFGDVSEIATLGAQLGIATKDLADFTTTVAEFSSITGISVDKAALSFGRLAELLNIEPAQFNNLSSAVVYAGINAVATDAEVLKMSESIAAASTQAGIAADETIGFATALASLKVRPEEARGVLTRLFREFDLLVAEGGSRLDDFSKVLGKTSEDTAAIWKTDPSQFVQSFLKGAEATGALNETMTALGITNSRELNVITRLANNMDVLDQALADTNEQYMLGTFSSEAYGKVADDLASKITVLQNSIAAMGASLGETVAGPLGDIVDALASFADTIRESPKAVRILIGAITALVAGLSIFIGLLTLGTAGLLALKLAFQNLSGSTVNANISLSTFRALLISMIPNAGGATTALGALGASLRATAAGATGAGFAMRGLALATSVALGPIGIAAALVGVFAISLMGISKEADKAKAAMFDAAGGFEAFKEASDTGLDSGVKVYREISLSAAELSDEEENLTRARLEANVEQLKLNTATEKGKAAYETASAKLKEFNDEVARGKGVIEESTIAITENTKQIYINALAAIQRDGNDPYSIYDSIANLTPEVEARLAKHGYDASEILATSIDMAMNGKDPVDFLQPIFSEIRQEDPWGVMFDGDWRTFTNDIYGAAYSLNDLNDSIENAGKEAAVKDRILGGLGVTAEETGASVDELNESLRAYVNSLTATNLIENKVSDALNTFAEGAKETGGALDGMGNSAKENLSNFASFMDAATEASIAAGEGTQGAVERIIGGLNSLDAAGIDTSQAYQLVQTMIINSMTGIAGADAQLKTQLAQAPNLAGMKKLVDSFYYAKAVASGWSSAIMSEWSKALAFFNQVGPTVEFKPITGAVKSAMTALEKLQQKISNVFRVKNIYVELYDSLDTLKQAFEDNGKTFSIYSEAGRSNISALQDTIDMFAEKSGGDVNKFANDLQSLRAALVQTGTPASGLKMIDDVISKIGVTGKASTHNVEQFTKALVATGATVRQLYAVKSAMDAITSGLRQGFSAVFAQADALDAVTLGWLDMSDAADAARESITNAKTDIRDARLEIEKLGAEIDGLAADKGKLQYQLSIALKYGDVLRANELRAEIAQLDADVAAKEASISDAQGSISQSTQQIADANGILGSNPNIRQQIERNNALRDMALRYGDIAASLMAAAEPGTDLNQIIEDQVTAFYDSAVEMGYSETAAQEMADVLRDELIYQMNQIPEDITTDITAETSVATAAVSKFVEYANNRLKQIKDKTVTVTTRMITYTSTVSGTSSNPTHWSTGGYIRGPGTGTSDSIPARLSNGEYVIKAAAVSKYGVDFFNSLNQMQGAPPARVGSAVSQSSGGGTVYLSTEDRQLLRAAIDRPITLYTDNATIAKSANEGNSILAQRGIR